MLRTVATLLINELALFEFGIACEVFGIDRSDQGVPPFEFRVCGPVAGQPLTTGVGVQLVPPFGLDGLVGADLAVVPAAGEQESYPPVVLEALRAAHAAGAVLLSVCSGAFILRAAGLLDGARAPPTGGTPTSSPHASRSPRWTRTCCSSTTGCRGCRPGPSSTWSSRTGSPRRPPARTPAPARSRGASRPSRAAPRCSGSPASECCGPSGQRIRVRVHPVRPSSARWT